MDITREGDISVFFVPEFFNIDTQEWQAIEKFKRPYDSLQYAKSVVKESKQLHANWKFRIRIEKFKCIEVSFKSI